MPQILSIDVGIKNLSYCLIDVTNDSVTVKKWDNVSITDANCKKLNVEQITECVLQTLMEHFDDTFFADVVLIENQPMLKNGLMKTVAVVMYTYFNMMKMQYGNINQVKFISATNKLKQKMLVNDDTNVSNTDNNDNKASTQTYKDRKKLSIQLAKQNIEKVAPSFKNWFDSQKKKDDCSDALNQGLYYVTHVMKKVIF